jgi:hypothetical protein
MSIILWKLNLLIVLLRIEVTRVLHVSMMFNIIITCFLLRGSSVDHLDTSLYLSHGKIIIQHRVPVPLGDLPVICIYLSRHCSVLFYFGVLTRVYTLRNHFSDGLSTFYFMMDPSPGLPSYSGRSLPYPRNNPNPHDTSSTQTTNMGEIGRFC